MTNFSENSIDNLSIEFRFAKTTDDLRLVKEIDDAAFGAHHGVSMEELIEVQNNGFVIMSFDRLTQNCTGQSQILLNPIADLQFSFTPGISYCYGIAVHPDCQGRGIGKILAIKQEEILLSLGISELHMTVRVENYSNLRVMIGLGHCIYNYNKTFYGPNPEDARIYLKKKLSSQAKSFVLDSLVFVPVSFGDRHDYDAHLRIGELIESGFCGVCIDRHGIYFEKVSN